MELPFNTPTVRGVLYTLVTLSAVVVFGNAAEACDIGICTPRRGAVIGFGVIATVTAAFAAVIALKRVGPLLKMEFFIALFLVVLFSVLVGLTSSLRTALGMTFAASFSWVGEILSIILVFGAAFAEESIFNRKTGDDDKDVETPPETEYTQPENTPQVPPSTTEPQPANTRPSEATEPTTTNK